MKKSLLLLCILIPALTWAGPVSRTKALGEAVSFIKEKHPQSAAPSITIAAQGEVTALGQPAYYIFNNGNAFQANASQTIAPFRAYFDIVSPSKPVNTINIIIIDDNPTGITNVNGNDNGNDNGWYTLEGHRLNSKPTQQGIYLHNGKKVSVRK